AGWPAAPVAAGTGAPAGRYRRAAAGVGAGAAPGVSCGGVSPGDAASGPAWPVRFPPPAGPALRGAVPGRV
ncbi:glycoside hydrolase 43 family protein, partial [Streptomyces sp. NPDC058618]